MICLIGVGINLPNSILKSSTPDLIETNNCKFMANTMNCEESFSENNILPPDENKVIIYTVYKYLGRLRFELSWYYFK